MMRNYFLLLLVLAGRLLAGEVYLPSQKVPPAVQRELRGVWIASVGNIDWPSTNGLTTAQQKAELIALLDRAAELKLNTIIFQVRPACDALYPSNIEPWSEYLTGTMGRAPEPIYDPLAFAIAEAHRRGLELHAWFNPFRARHLAAKSAIAPNHVYRRHPEWVVHYGKSLWLDPGQKGARQYSVNVILDVVRRYDIDGVHLDDYFYPYKEQNGSGQDLDFPDWGSWKRYGAGGRLRREDWRRENVNNFVHDLYRAIKSTKPWVKFGISPFGIWRPGNPPQIRGLDAFEVLHADSRKWLAEGWVDYLSPQLYWGVAAPETSFPVLLRWWSQQNARGRLLCPGLNSYNAGRTWPTEEIVEQVRLSRRESGAGGHVHWNMKALMHNGALDSALAREVYGEPAVVPPAPWLSRNGPAKPELTVGTEKDALIVNWNVAPAQSVQLWVLQSQTRGKWNTQILPSAARSVRLTPTSAEVVALSCMDRCGNMSPAAVLERKKQP